MTNIIKRCRGEKTRGIRVIDGFRNKLMIPDSEIPKCPEFEVKSKIIKFSKNQNPLYEIDPCFLMNITKLIKLGVNIYYLVFIFTLVSVF